jgi:hypothetical protein
LQTGGNTGTVMDVDGTTPLALDTDLRFRTSVKEQYYSDTLTKSRIGFDAILNVPTALAPVSWVCQLIDLLMPIGMIIMWYGDYTTIPAGWTLCSGGTVNGYTAPPLHGRFVVGCWPGYVSPAGHAFSAGASGGTAGDLVHTHPIYVQDTTLNYLQIPPHVHGTNAQLYDTIVGRTNPGGSFNFTTNGPSDGYNVVAISNGADVPGGPGGGPHNHPAYSTDNSEPPPYWAICYIMKIRNFYVPIP